MIFCNGVREYISFRKLCKKKKTKTKENIPSPIASDPFIMRIRLHESTNIL